MKGQDLTIHIGQRNRIGVDEIKGADPRTGKRLRRIPADAAESEHRGAASGKAFQPAPSDQHFRARELMLRHGYSS